VWCNNGDYLSKEEPEPPPAPGGRPDRRRGRRGPRLG
jgi:hypothetical protein